MQNLTIFIYLFFVPMISLKILTWRRPDVSKTVGERIATYGIFAALNVFISAVTVDIIRNITRFTIQGDMFQYGIIALVTAILLPFIAEVFITAGKAGNVHLEVTKKEVAPKVDASEEKTLADGAKETIGVKAVSETPAQEEANGAEAGETDDAAIDETQLNEDDQPAEESAEEPEESIKTEKEEAEDQENHAAESEKAEAFEAEEQTEEDYGSED